jgi:murein DD-endopeptidase MepM/ murein hydrolase activator NlpD
MSVFAFPPATAFAQGAPSFSLPLDCEIGKACVVQSYVDHDPGASARDYRCGFLSYDGHKGTDIRVTDSDALRRGVAVIAAATGRVRAVRDGMPDRSVRDAGKGAVAGREAGNSVVVSHGDGWETQYAHLRKGSVAVRAGDTVQQGQRLGLVGLSGNTEFPHLHFEVRREGKAVDPFVGVGTAEPCQPGIKPLWQENALPALAYVATGVLDAGISGAPPSLNAGSVDRERTENLTSKSAAAVFWVQMFGAQQDDLEEFRLIAPDGRVLTERRTRVSRNLAQWLAYTGIRRSGEAWPSGIYRGEYALYRGSEQKKLLSLVREIRID